MAKKYLVTLTSEEREALLALTRNGQRKVAPITGFPRKGSEGERVAEGSVRAMKQGNACGAKGPYCVHILYQHWEAGA